MSNMKRSVTFVVHGEPASKANSRRIALIQGKVRVIKSSKALSYVDTFDLQCPKLVEPFEGPVKVTLDMFYASKRPDLDESIVLDCMQSKFAINPRTKERTLIGTRIYHNDRQVREKHVYWHLDRKNPRVEITVEELPDES